MRELDLRLARVTGRARELKLLARDATEQAERAAMGVASSTIEVNTCRRVCFRVLEVGAAMSLGGGGSSPASLRHLPRPFPALIKLLA